MEVPIHYGDPLHRVSFNRVASCKRNIVKKTELQLLLESPAERESVLRRNRHWFDCPNETFDKVVAEIASMEDPRRRIETTESWQKLSAHVFYASLHQKLQERNEMHPSDLLPTDVESLVRFLRINPEVGSGAAFQVFLATVTEKLIHEEGLQKPVRTVVEDPLANR